MSKDLSTPGPSSTHAVVSLKAIALASMGVVARQLGRAGIIEDSDTRHRSHQWGSVADGPNQLRMADLRRRRVRMALSMNW